jgi:hypothetical protein
MTDFIAVIVYTLCLGVSISGIIIVRKISGHRRWSGAVLAVLAVSFAGLLTLMSSKYWFGDQTFFHSFIDIKVIELFSDIGIKLVALALGLCVALVVGPDGYLYVTDFGVNSVYRIIPTSNIDIEAKHP